MGVREQFKPFDAAEYLDTPSARASYLKAMWEDCGGDAVIVATALGDVARAMGMSQIARDTGVAREALYKALSPQGNPELATIMRVLGAIGLELSVRPRKGGAASVTAIESGLRKTAAKGARKATTGPTTTTAAGRATRRAARASTTK